MTFPADGEAGVPVDVTLLVEGYATTFELSIEGESVPLRAIEVGKNAASLGAPIWELTPDVALQPGRQYVLRAVAESGEVNVVGEEETISFTTADTAEGGPAPTSFSVELLWVTAPPGDCGGSRQLCVRSDLSPGDLGVIAAGDAERLLYFGTQQSHFYGGSSSSECFDVWARSADGRTSESVMVCDIPTIDAEAEGVQTTNVDLATLGTYRVDCEEAFAIAEGAVGNPPGREGPEGGDAANAQSSPGCAAVPWSGEVPWWMLLVLLGSVVRRFRAGAARAEAGAG